MTGVEPAYTLVRGARAASPPRDRASTVRQPSLRPSSNCPAARPCADGDFTAWVTELVDRHRDRLVSLVRRQGLHAEETFDCVQEAFHTFLRLPQARALAGHAEESGRLLTTIARNAARTRRRRAATLRLRTAEAPAVDGLLDEGAGAEQLLARAEETASLRQCVRSLNEMQQAVVTLRLLEDLPGEQVASTLGLSPQNVAVLLHRAKASLRGCMAAAGHCGAGRPDGG
jgi:RNA polymerase sigma-70 factor (ECF subfamily)